MQPALWLPVVNTEKAQSQGEVYVPDRQTTIQYYLCHGMSNPGLKCRELKWARETGQVAKRESCS